MLAYHLEWHLRRRLAPVLFQDDDPAAAAAERSSPIQEASVSPKAQRKSARKRTENGFPVHSLDTLMGDLATLTLNQLSLPGQPESVFLTLTQPTPLQAEVFRLLEINPQALIPVPTY